MKYKMSDVFELPVRRHYSAIIDRNGAQCSYMNQVDCAAHAINNHDRLTAQVNELSALMRMQQGWLLIDPDYRGSPLEARVNELLTRIGEDNA